MKFNKVYEILLEKVKIVNLNNFSLRELSNDMLDVERLNFTSRWRNDLDELEEHFSSPGFYGLGLFEDDTNKLVGYIYGSAIGEDEYENMDELSKDDIHLNPKYHDFNIEDARNIFTPSNTFHIGNFAVNKEYRIYVRSILLEFLKNLRPEVKYISFDALDHSTGKMLFNSDGSPKVERLKSAGLETIGYYNSGGHILTILERI